MMDLKEMAFECGTWFVYLLLIYFPGFALFPSFFILNHLFLLLKSSYIRQVWSLGSCSQFGIDGVRLSAFPFIGELVSVFERYYAHFSPLKTSRKTDCATAH
jgi:hypothetical protein